MNKNLLILSVGQYGQIAKEAAENMDCFEKIAFKLEEACFRIAILVIPKAYVNPSVQLMKSTIIELKAVVNTNNAVAIGVFVCVGAIVNHNSFVDNSCQLDCGSVFASNVVLLAKTKLKRNEVFDKDHVEIALCRFHNSCKFEDGV